MAEVVDTTASVHVNSALLEFNRTELEVLHNVMIRVQCGMKGYGEATSNILSTLDELLGEVEGTDHYVEMYSVGGHSLYWSQPSDSGLHWDRA